MMKRNKSNIRIVITLGIALLASSIVLAQDEEKPGITKAQHLSDLEALKVKRDSTHAVLKQMELPALVEQMNKDSKTREHFNSSAYREVVNNRKSESQALFEIIQKQQKAAYIPLMALRKINKEAYDSTDVQLRLDALADALRETIVYNRWGIPHLYWQAPAKSMIELGGDAEKTLKSFLSDESPCGIMGYEEELEMEAYKYRRCDYALAMLMVIRDQNVKEIPKDPAKRDKMIEEILAEEE